MEIELPDKLGFLLERNRWRYKGAYGGRGSAKSWGAARALEILATAKQLRILCGREVQKSIKDSVYTLLKDQLELMNMGPEWETTRDEIRNRRNGSIFLFTGLADQTVESIKSFEGIDIFWGEEAQRISERSWSLIIPTIRKDRSEIWFTMNPELDTDPTFQRFIKNPPPDSKIVQMNWSDNPWFPEVLRKEKDYLYSVDPDTAQHIWGGECRRFSDAQILRGRYQVREFEAKEGLWDGPYHGIDFGFAQDLGIMVRCWIWEGDLYIEYEAAGLEVETDMLPALWDTIPNARNYIARADNSRPETISQVKRLGYQRVIACKKWKGCEEDGIEHLRSYRNIVIHPRCVETAKEAANWSWKRDRLTGDILPQTTGKFDNSWSAVRYALEPIIMHGLRQPEVEQEEDFETMMMRQHGGSDHSWMG